MPQTIDCTQKTVIIVNILCVMVADDRQRIGASGVRGWKGAFVGIDIAGLGIDITAHDNAFCSGYITKHGAVTDFFERVTEGCVTAARIR